MEDRHLLNVPINDNWKIAHLTIGLVVVCTVLFLIIVLIIRKYYILYCYGCQLNPPLRNITHNELAMEEVNLPLANLPNDPPACFVHQPRALPSTPFFPIIE